MLEYRLQATSTGGTRSLSDSFVLGITTAGWIYELQEGWITMIGGLQNCTGAHLYKRESEHFGTPLSQWGQSLDRTDQSQSL